MAKATEPADRQAGDGRVGPGREGLVDLYRQMVLVRTFEESCQRSFRKGAIGDRSPNQSPARHDPSTQYCRGKRSRQTRYAVT
jgi:hypothetical protein